MVPSTDPEGPEVPADSSATATPGTPLPEVVLPEVPDPVEPVDPGETRRASIEETRRRSAELFTELLEEGASQAARDEARDALVRLHLPLVEHCARRFRNRGEPFEDLVQVGTIGLIKAVDRFETDRGVEFSTYATPTVIGGSIVQPECTIV